MRTILQRVTQAMVHIDDKEYSRIDRGLLVYVFLDQDDTQKTFEWISNKILHLRIFKDSNNQLNTSLSEIGGGILCIPNFTLKADVKKGTRPNFSPSARSSNYPPLTFDEKKQQFELFLAAMRRQITDVGKDGTVYVGAGVFGADMTIYSEAQGPINIIIDR